MLVNVHTSWRNFVNLRNCLRRWYSSKYWNKTGLLYSNYPKPIENGFRFKAYDRNRKHPYWRCAIIWIVSLRLYRVYYIFIYNYFRQWVGVGLNKSCSNCTACLWGFFLLFSTCSRYDTFVIFQRFPFLWGRYFEILFWLLALTISLLSSPSPFWRDIENKSLVFFCGLSCQLPTPSLFRTQSLAEKCAEFLSHWDTRLTGRTHRWVRQKRLTTCILNPIVTPQ